MRKPLRLALLYVLVGISGFSALAIELVYTKYLGYVFGTTAYAISTVLAAFMGGLALGNLWGGRLSLRVKNPVRWYGLLELVVGLFGLVSPLLFSGVRGIMGWLSPHLIALPAGSVSLTVLRFILASLVVLPPTIAMGTSFPLLVRWLTAYPSLGGRVARLYTVNTWGAAAGALLSAYVIIQGLGLFGTLVLVLGNNLAVCLLAWFVLGREDNASLPSVSEDGGEEAGSPSHDHQNDEARWSSLLSVGTLAAFSGFVTLAFEVVWSHLLAVVIGTSTYAFGLVLGLFLLALGVGGWSAARFIAPLPPRKMMAALSGILVACAMLVIWLLPAWDKTGPLFELVGYSKPSFVAREGLRAAVAAMLIFLPACLMGMIFPITLVLQGTHRREIGRRIGSIYAINTFGTILGSTLTGFVLIQWLGSQDTLRLLAATLLLAGLGSFFTIQGRHRQVAVGLGILWGVVELSTMEPWNVARLANGSNIYFAPGFDLERNRIVHFAEDVHGGLTAVVSDGELRTLLTNGKFEGNDGPERADQILFAVVPAAYPGPKQRALNIGIGTGQTLAVLRASGHPSLSAVDISPNIVAAARGWFQSINHNVLDAANTRVYFQDGRNYLQMSDERYDLIAIELTSVWFAGAGNLYSKEFYELCQQRLAKGGILSQWIQLHHITLEDVAAIIRTVHSVFPSVEMWMGGHQGMLIASDGPLRAEPSRVFGLGEEMQGLLRVAHIERQEDLARRLLVTADQMSEVLRRISRQPSRISTDDNLLLEYSTPQGNVLEDADVTNLKAIQDAVASIARKSPR
jgi:spermidine synthase